MKMTRLTGFTEAELAAFEWSKNQKEREKSIKSGTSKRELHNKRRRSYSTDTKSSSLSHSVSSKSSDSDSNGSERSRHLSHRTTDHRSSRLKNTHRSPKDPRRSSVSSTSSSYSPSRRHTKTHSTSRKNHEVISKYNKSTTRRHGRARKSRTRSYSGSSLESSRSSNDLPRDPFNPLNLAYSHKYHSSSSRHRNRSRDKTSFDKPLKTPGKDHEGEEDRWKHDLYESDSERVSHEAQIKKNKLYNAPYKSYNKSDTTSKSSNKFSNGSDTDSDSSRHNSNSGVKHTLITKRGWKSRAGGVYIPGDEDEDLYYDRRRSVSYERPDPSYTLD